MQSEILPGIADAFTFHYGELRDAAFEEWPALTFSGAQIIMDSLAGNLWRYRRPAGPGFVRWATAWVRREARRHHFLTELFRQNHRLIYAAVERSLFQSPGIDCATGVEDHEANIFLHILEDSSKLKGLMQPAKAKPSTVLYALAQSRMRGVRKQLKKRRAKVARCIEDLCAAGCEIADPPDAEEMEKKLQAA